ncbi:hypothetical protein [Yoonia sp. TsM2_T14_4]|uniref:hypothetical protein n=1 Tax=Yoonia sp. TsM2_T14_4 TaxID=3415141 RepID=UPI003C73B078
MGKVHIFRVTPKFHANNMPTGQTGSGFSVGPMAMVAYFLSCRDQQQPKTLQIAQYGKVTAVAGVAMAA